MKKITLNQRNKITNGKISANGLHKISGNGLHKRLTTAKTPAAPEAHGNGFSLRLLQNGEKQLTIQIKGDAVQSAPKTVSPWLNPTQLERPAFLMNFPFSYATECANNPWMVDMKGDKRAPNFTRASVQFLEVYRNISAEGLVYLLPTPRGVKLQDLLYTANLGIVLEHLPDKNTVIISNFASPPRRGETPVGVEFFRNMGYEVHVAPNEFEGEAELKHLYDNVYVGGYGIRSEKETYDWMEQNFDMRIVKVREAEPYLYHLDCSIFPITKENTLVCTELFTKKEVAQLEKVTNVISVSVDECFSGICNSVRLPNQVLNSSHIHDLKAGTQDYQYELEKNRKLEDIASNLALEVGYFNLSEFHKSGALLSCMVMHLNRHSYKVALTA
jgi:N-dimethylarginine dimethylaminohydrolase